MIPFPADLPVVLDRRTVALGDGRTLFGGDPPRLVRLTPRGREVLNQLRNGAADSTEATSLVRRLIESGLAHPQPPPTTSPGPDVTVVIPVRDRPDSLERCLSSLDLPALVVDDGSDDREAIAAACVRHGARLVRRDQAGGPGAARNTGAAHTTTELIAFLDSDCLATPGWMEHLCGHFADPPVAAVAPRIRPLGDLRSASLARYLEARSPLDAGPDPAEVGRGRRLTYVPSTALIVRRSAMDGGFDPGLRYGEDVDLVWRLTEKGWRVRYDPRAIVRHAEPHRLASLLRRRFHYGTAAGALAQRHPGALAPAVLDAKPLAVLSLLALGRRVPAAALLGSLALRSSHRLARLGAPARLAWSGSGRSLVGTAVSVGRLATTLPPAGVAAARICRSRRSTAAVLLAAVPAHDWLRLRPRLDPVRWLMICLADDLAYAAGIWTGALRARSTEPLRPVFRWRSQERHST